MEPGRSSGVEEREKEEEEEEAEEGEGTIGEEGASGTEAGKPGLFRFWRRVAGGRQKEFWRWTAGVGWTLDLLLLAWALFLRNAGYVDKGSPGNSASVGNAGREATIIGGSTAAEVREAREAKRYQMLLDRELTEERSLSDSDSKLNTLVSEASSKLREISASVQDLLRPDDEAPPRYDDAVLSGMVEDLQLRVENDRELLRERDEKLLAELEEKPAILRDLSARVGKQKQMAQVKVARVMVGVQDTRPASNTNGDDTALLLQGAVLPVATFLIVSLFVTVLSQQFVRVATAWRRRQWAKAEKARKIQLRRFQTFQRTASRAWDELQQGKFEEARDDFGELFRFLERWSSEPTWEELFRAEGAAFWERWGPGAFRLEATLPGIQAAPKEGPEMGRWVAERWADSAQNVIKGYALGALRDWAKEGGPAPSAGNASASSQAPQPTGLVIRIFGRWPREPWVNVANLPLAGDWREKALRLLLPAEKDVQDLPIIGPLCDTALTAVVSSQVTRVVKTSVWGSLTTDLWTADARRGRPANGGTQEAFQIGYEVVEVNSQVPDDMCALAREMPVSGTPGRVVRVRPEIENTLGSLDAS